MHVAFESECMRCEDVRGRAEWAIGRQRDTETERKEGRRPLSPSPRA